MQPGRRFIENVESASGRFFRKLGRELYPLRFTTRKGSRRLTQPQISKPNIEQRVQFLRYARNIAEKTRRFIATHIKHIGDVFAFIGDLERLPVVAMAMADFTLDVNVWEEMHLDFDEAATFAIFAPAAFDIETETAGIVAPHPCRRQLRKELANGCKCPCVSDRVRPRCAPNCALIDDDGLIDLFHATQAAEATWSLLGIVKMAEQCPPQNVVDQSGFPAARNTGHAGETAKWKRHGHIFQIVFRCADHG